MILAAKNLFYPSQRVHIMSVDNYAILNISSIIVLIINLTITQWREAPNFCDFGSDDI